MRCEDCEKRKATQTRRGGGEWIPVCDDCALWWPPHRLGPAPETVRSCEGEGALRDADGKLAEDCPGCPECPNLRERAERAERALKDAPGMEELDAAMFHINNLTAQVQRQRATLEAAIDYTIACGDRGEWGPRDPQPSAVAALGQIHHILRAEIEGVPRQPHA